MSRASAFQAEAMDKGFTADQAEFLYEHLSQKPHTHTADQITDLDETIMAAIEAESDENEDEDEEDD